jgi:lipopolysaccharide export system permease protein
MADKRPIPKASMTGGFNLQRPRRTPGESAVPTPSPEQVVASVTTVRPGGSSSGGFLSKPLINTMDLYVLRGFLWSYLLFLLVLLSLFIVIDMVVKFDEFAEINDASNAQGLEGALGVLWGIFDYYRFQVFRIFALLGGLVPVFAAAFTLMRMSRNNELSALLAAGVPLLRVSQPIILAALVLNLILLPINQEIVVPKFFPQLTRERGATISLGAGQPLQGLSDGINRRLFAGAYYPPASANQRPSMEVVHIIEQQRLDNDDPQSDVVARTIISADRAEWDASGQRWILENGIAAPGMSLGGASAVGVPVTEYKGSITPESISLFLDHNFVDLLSTSRINQLLAQPDVIGLTDLMRVRDARLASFVLNIILVLLTIPAVLTREPLLLRAATARVFMLVGGCLATIFITQSLAGQQAPTPALLTKWPAIMAWVPIFLFTPVALFMIDRVKS